MKRVTEPERLAGRRQLNRELDMLIGYWLERQDATGKPDDLAAWDDYMLAHGLCPDGPIDHAAIEEQLRTWFAAREAAGQSIGLAEWNNYNAECDRGPVQEAIRELRDELAELGRLEAMETDSVNPMAAVVDKVNEIESLNGELAQTAENAWLPEEETFQDADRQAVLAALAALRTERDQLESELDALIGGLNGGS